MSIAFAELSRAKEVLRRETHYERWNYGQLADHLEELAALFARIPKEDRRELIGRFHDIAGRLPVVDVLDSDYGALVLEARADAVAEEELKEWLYTEAKYRAGWCAKGGTAGAECIARYDHVKRIEQKQKKPNQSPEPMPLKRHGSP